VQGPSISSFDYGACIEAEDCSVKLAYRQHRGDGRYCSLRRAAVKAALITGPIAAVLLAATAHQ
jgi:hypothetical protein